MAGIKFYFVKAEKEFGIGGRIIMLEVTGNSEIREKVVGKKLRNGENPYSLFPIPYSL